MGDIKGSTHKYPPKRKYNAIITPQQLLAVDNFVNPNSNTFGNKTQSYMAAKYKSKGRIAQNAACRFFQRDYIIKAIRDFSDKNIEIAEKQAVNEAITKAYTLEQLQKTYRAAVTDKDTTNRVACIRLMMQYHGLLNDKLVIDLQDSRQLEEGHREAARRIAAHLLSDGILEAEFEPLALPATNKDDHVQSDNSSPDNIIDSSE